MDDSAETWTYSKDVNRQSTHLLQYTGPCPDVTAVRAALHEGLPTGAYQFIKGIRNTRKALALHWGQQRAGPFKADITRLAKCASADATQKWERILFRNLDMQEVVINQKEVAEEVTRSHPIPPKK